MTESVNRERVQGRDLGTPGIRSWAVGGGGDNKETPRGQPARKEKTRGISEAKGKKWFRQKTVSSITGS